MKNGGGLTGESVDPLHGACTGLLLNRRLPRQLVDHRRHRTLLRLRVGAARAFRIARRRHAWVVDVSRTFIVTASGGNAAALRIAP